MSLAKFIERAKHTYEHFLVPVFVFDPTHAVDSCPLVQQKLIFVVRNNFFIHLSKFLLSVGYFTDQFWAKVLSSVLHFFYYWLQFQSSQVLE